MKLFSLPDGVIDRKDRAQWLTLPFDLEFRNVLIGPWHYVALGIHQPGGEASGTHQPGSVMTGSHQPGSAAAGTL